MFTNRGFLAKERRSLSSKSSYLSPSQVAAIRSQAKVPSPVDFLNKDNRRNFYRSYKSSPVIRQVISPTYSLSPTKSIRNSISINASKTSSIIKIFSNKGYGGFRVFVGVGFLITPTLLLTSYSNLPNHNVASNSLVSFNDMSKSFRLRPEQFFLTHESLKFTIVAVDSLILHENKGYIPITPDFTLKYDDAIVYYNKTVETKIVRLIDQDTFCYNAMDVPPGLPIFDIHWNLQGIHISTSSNYTVCQALKVDSIYRALETDSLAQSFSEISQLYRHIPVNAQETVKHFWFDWYSKNIYIIGGDNSLVKTSPNNSVDLDQKEYWYFNWNCRYIYLSRNDILIVGGLLNKDKPSNQVFLYRILENVLHRVPPMNSPREGAALVCVDFNVYVIGGKGTESCESLDLESYRWRTIASLSAPRYEHVACSVFDKFIFVLGGLPERMSSTFEKYTIANDVWEREPIRLQDSFVHSAVFMPRHDQICVFGGRFNNKVWVFTVNDRSQVRVTSCPSIDSPIETAFPVLVADGVVYVLCGKDGYINLRVKKYPLGLFSANEGSLLGNSYSPPVLNTSEFLPPIRRTNR